MATATRTGSLEIAQDLDHQAREWRIEHVAWIVFAGVLAAALLGLFGPGLFGPVRAGNAAASLGAEYYRIQRFQAPASLRVHLAGALVQGGVIRLRLDRAFVDNVELRRIDPVPQAEFLEADTVTYLFGVPASNADLAVAFRYQPNAYGPLRLVLALDGAPPLAFTTFVLP